MFRGFLLLVLCVTVCYSLKFADRTDELFTQFKKTYGRRYATAEEELKRKDIFAESMRRVDAKNEINGEPVFGVTKFSDWTESEFKVLLGRKQGEYVPTRKVEVRDPLTPHVWGASRYANDVSSGLPGYINWVQAGATTPVKNQGQCGACWAFSVAEQIESEWILQGNAAWEFSVQQVASCTSGCSGCGGGYTSLGFEYVEGVIGLGSSWFAPYTQSMYVSCDDTACTVPCSTFSMTDLQKYSYLTGPYASVKSYSYATPTCSGSCNNQNTTLLAMNVATYGPASICVNAASWNDYTGGVLTQAACGAYSMNSIDHCVQLVGYYSASASPYWMVRNSWSTDWGVNGYIQLQYPQNTCGLANEAMFVSISNSQSNFSG